MFKESFKYYKSKNPPPNLQDVLDFQYPDKMQKKIKKVNVTEIQEQGKNFGVKPPKTWECYELIEHPGLIFIKNPFTNIGQRYWSIRCLQDYSKKPNKSNLDSFSFVPQNKEWWDMCQTNKNNILTNKLRWVTLGYHHDWDTKLYNENDKGEFPKDLSDFTKFITQVMGFDNFNAEAAIVNYYHMNSTLSGHTDLSEKNLQAPLISLSFGQTAIFLVGGKTKEQKPTAMFLRSGDIIIMSKESRLCYHGVPKILQIDSRFWNDFENNNEPINLTNNKHIADICTQIELWTPFGDYLSHSRININIRQVLNRGQKRLHDENNEEDEQEENKQTTIKNN